MLLALLHYKVSREDIEPYLPEHISFLKDGYAKGDLIASGPMLNNKGGVILSSLTRRPEFEEFLRKDPFMIHDLASFEIIAFDPTRFHPDFKSFVRSNEQEDIVLVSYTPEWELKFKEEAAALAAIFSDNLLETHHIGSTAIPGIVAKPIVDILPVVKDIQAVDSLTPSFEALGYEVRGEFGMPGRRFFVKKQDGKRTFNVHTFQEGHPDINRHLRFRDYLIAHPKDAAAYSELKKKLVEKSPTDIEQYCWGKEDFIKNIDAKALLWQTRFVT